LHRGFTLAELVLVLVIIGVLATFAVPRFFTRQGFDARGFADQTASAIRYAQKLAVASGCEVQATITGAGYVLNQRLTNCTTGAFTRDVRHPGTGETTFTAAPPAGVSIAATVSPIVFNALGQASSASTITVGGRTLQVVAETGLVYAP